MILTPTKDIQAIQDLFYIQPDLNHDWLIVIKEDEEIGLIELQPITKITAAIHLHICPEYQNKGYGIKVYLPLLEYVRNTRYKKLLVTVAAMNKRLLRVLTKTDFKPCGTIHDGIIWDGIRQDLLLFELEV